MTSLRDGDGVEGGGLAKAAVALVSACGLVGEGDKPPLALLGVMLGEVGRQR